MSKLIKSNQEIINLISKIVEPYMKFNMGDIYGDRGGIPYPEIESLDMLHFRYFNCKNYSICKNKENELINQVKLLGFGDIQIHRYNGIGKFMVITLDKYHNKIIQEYSEYQTYRNSNAEKINDIYQYLEEKVPEEFVGWCLFKQN